MLRAALFAFLLVTSAVAQSSFEAASVKPFVPGHLSGSLRGGPGTESPGQITGTASMKALLMRAYGVKSYQIAGPAWLDSERYEIAAKVPEGATKETIPAMFRTLLAERFGLAAHTESKELPVYFLAVAKNGPKLKESGADATLDPSAVPKLVRGADGFPDLLPGSDVPRSYEVVVGGSDGILYKLWARRESMDDLADRLSSQLNRPVIDRTGLQKQYNFALSWVMDNPGGGVPRTSPPPDEIDFHATPIGADPGLSIFAALGGQLGLKLENGRAPVEIVVVDQIQRAPTAN